MIGPRWSPAGAPERLQIPTLTSAWARNQMQLHIGTTRLLNWSFLRWRLMTNKTTRSPFPRPKWCRLKWLDYRSSARIKLWMYPLLCLTTLTSHYSLVTSALLWTWSKLICIGTTLLSKLRLDRTSVNVTVKMAKSRLKVPRPTISEEKAAYSKHTDIPAEHHLSIRNF